MAIKVLVVRLVAVVEQAFVTCLAASLCAPVLQCVSVEVADLQSAAREQWQNGGVFGDLFSGAAARFGECQRHAVAGLAAPRIEPVGTGTVRQIPELVAEAIRLKVDVLVVSEVPGARGAPTASSCPARRCRSRWSGARSPSGPERTFGLD